jgi:hypothetical protein
VTCTTSGTRKRLAAAAACLLAGLALAGCSSAPVQQTQQQWDAAAVRFEQSNARWNEQYEREFHDPMSRHLRPSQYRLDPVLPDPPADEATMARDWERSGYVYPSGAVPAYPTYNLNYEDRPDWLANDYYYTLAQPGIVLVDVALLPVWLFAEPPWVDINYHGARYEPSMTVAPPLPPAQ